MIHGRYIYSTDDIGNDLRVHLPPVNSIKGHQWDTIFTNSKYGPPFDELWASAVDITLRWNEVANAVREHLKHKKTKRRTSKSMGNRPYPTNLDKKPRKSGISTPQ